jgi:DNA processing protein
MKARSAVPGRRLLGSGIDEVYPRSNSKLAERIAAEGLIVSEYPPGTPPRAGQFPRRNRIIAGLALGTLVVEAARQSGSLITARLAAEHGREVFAIPGSIHSALSKGCHALLRDGAKLVEDIGDILIEIAPGIVVELDDAGATESRSAPDELTGARRKLAETLDFSPVTIDELAGCTGLTPAELSSMLLHLEMEGAVEALPGGRYSRLMKRT